MKENFRRPLSTLEEVNIMRKNLGEDKIMKITPTQSGYTFQKLTTKNEETSIKNTPLPASSEPLMDVLKNVQRQLQAMPEVDQARIDELKTAIKQGHIQLNPEALAQAMLKYHRG